MTDVCQRPPVSDNGRASIADVQVDSQKKNFHTDMTKIMKKIIMH